MDLLKLYTEKRGFIKPVSLSREPTLGSLMSVFHEISIFITDDTFTVQFFFFFNANLDTLIFLRLVFEMCIFFIILFSVSVFILKACLL